MVLRRSEWIWQIEVEASKCQKSEDALSVSVRAGHVTRLDPEPSAPPPAPLPTSSLSQWSLLSDKETRKRACQGWQCSV